MILLETIVTTFVMLTILFVMGLSYCFLLFLYAMTKMTRIYELMTGEDTSLGKEQAKDVSPKEINK